MPFGIVDFVELKIGAEDLQKIPPSYLALMMACNFAINELMALQRMMILHLNSSHVPKPSAPVRSVLVASLGMLNRVSSSKIYEFVHLINGFIAEERKAPADGEFSELLIELLKKELRGIEKTHAFRIAKNIRNKITNHYSYSDFKRFAFQANGGSGANIWLAEISGNTIYDLGEELSNVGFFADHHDLESALESWVDWVIDGIVRVSAINENVSSSVIDKYLENATGRVHRIIIDDSLLADINGTTIPLFWKPAKNGMVR